MMMTTIVRQLDNAKEEIRTIHKFCCCLKLNIFVSNLITESYRMIKTREKNELSFNLAPNQWDEKFAQFLPVIIWRFLLQLNGRLGEAKTDDRPTIVNVD